MKLPPQLHARWRALAPREKMLAAGAAALVAFALLWWLLIAPPLAVLRTSDAQHTALDAQLQRMRGLQSQAQGLQSQPRINPDEAARLLESAVRQRLGTTARMVVAGDRVTLTLTSTPPDALAQWLQLARVNARALPSEARLTRGAAGGWDGTLVLTLPPR
jgi:general secretion pathway protein M